MEQNKLLDNAVALMGFIATEIIEIYNIYGLAYDGYAATVETIRKNGVADYAVVVMPQDTDTAQLEAAVETGKPVMVTGKIQTFKDFSTGKVLVYVLADYIAAVDGKHWIDQNEVRLIGTLGRNSIYRETPKGKRITDIKVIVPNAIRDGGSCYIPCVCWNDEADKVKDWQEGTQIELSGRLQSREYTKRINDDTEELRTCYEVSVNKIHKSEV